MQIIIVMPNGTRHVLFHGNDDIVFSPSIGETMTVNGTKFLVHTIDHAVETFVAFGCGVVVQTVLTVQLTNVGL